MSIDCWRANQLFDAGAGLVAITAIAPHLRLEVFQSFPDGPV